MQDVVSHVLTGEGGTIPGGIVTGFVLLATVIDGDGERHVKAVVNADARRADALGMIEEFKGQMDMERLIETMGAIQAGGR